MRELFSRKNKCTSLVDASGNAAKKYQHFKKFLQHNHKALSTIASLEGLSRVEAFSLQQIQTELSTLIQETQGLCSELEAVSSKSFTLLTNKLESIQKQLHTIFTPVAPPKDAPFTLALKNIHPSMELICGSKATNLASIRNILLLPTPDGFTVTSTAFSYFLQKNSLNEAIKQLLQGIDTTLVVSSGVDTFAEDVSIKLEHVSAEIRNLILDASLPDDLADQILAKYTELFSNSNRKHVAVRSSAVGEDTELSYAGQYASILNVTEDNLLQAYKEILASKYTPRAMVYRFKHGIDDEAAPMCVLIIGMVNSLASGVTYTIDPADPHSGSMKISTILGLGELLASGESGTDIFHMSRATGDLMEAEICPKDYYLECLPEGGTKLVQSPPDKKDKPAVESDILASLYKGGMDLEAHFHTAQDIEWALDKDEGLFYLQSRPLVTIRSATTETAKEYDDNPRLISTGRVAAPGIATGKVFIAQGNAIQNIPEEAIFVAHTASPDYAAILGRIGGIITDIGSPASHLASVAREFGVPALFNCGNATKILQKGQEVTLYADTMAVYEGAVKELTQRAGIATRAFVDSPTHKKLRAILEIISPLHLTNPKSDLFIAESCQSVHDIIRFAHETANRSMFSMGKQGLTSNQVVRLNAGIPIALYCVDLGGGFVDGLTVCDKVFPYHVNSLPLKALLQGLTHPAINWASAVGFNTQNMFSVVASSATADRQELGNDSYAILSNDYMNLSIKFGYHYTNIDTFCSNIASQNHIILKFAGGAGDYQGRSLRIGFLGEVLQKLNYNLHIQGDSLEAVITGLDQENTKHVLDQTGRLFASCRLLDMALRTPADVERLYHKFFAGEYDFLGKSRPATVPNYYTLIGNWSEIDDADTSEKLIQQDGSIDSPETRAYPSVFERVFGRKQQSSIKAMEAYFQFPLAVKRGTRIGNATVMLDIKPISGNREQIGGLAFGLQNEGTYYVLRLNALYNNILLLEFTNNRRKQLAKAPSSLKAGNWYQLGVTVRDNEISCFLNNVKLFDVNTERPAHGFVGLWTVADSVTVFKQPEITLLD